MLDLVLQWKMELLGVLILLQMVLERLSELQIQQIQEQVFVYRKSEEYRMWN